MRSLALVAAVVSLSGCELLNEVVENGSEHLPTVTYQEATLVQSPSQEQLAAYYCPRVVPADGWAEELARDAACAVAFGTVSPQDLRVAFRLTYKIHNPNNFPIPVTEMLTAATVFPAKTNQSLGAACVSFCAEGDVSCTPGLNAAGCRSSSSDIRTLDDFGNAAAGMLVASGVQLANGETPTFRAPEVISDSEITLSAIFSFGADPLLATLESLAEQSVSQLENGTLPTFTIPYSIEGTVWMDGGSLGRLEVGFGPAEGSWTLPVEELTAGY